MKILILISAILILFSFLWLIIWAWFFRIPKETLIRIKDIGQKAFDKGDYKRAKELIVRALKNGSNAKLKYQLAVCHLNLGEFSDAQKLFEELLAASPNNIDLMSKLAKALDKQRKNEEAIELNTKILEKDPKNLDSLISIAESYYKKDEPNKS